MNKYVMCIGERTLSLDNVG